MDVSPIVIVGPTASGKSTLAHMLALRTGRSIYNADSMQVYRNFPTLAAHPPRHYYEEVSYHMYGVTDVVNNLTVYDWQKGIQKTNSIIVGGTGLYIRALLYGLHTTPCVTDTARQKVLSMSPHERQDFLERLGESLPLNDNKRLMRHLGVYFSTGKTLSSFWTKPTQPLLSNCRVIYLCPDKTTLLTHIEKRLSEAFSANIFEEVEMVYKRQLPASLPGLQLIGYREICAVLEKKITPEKAFELMYIRTRQYAKRQRTWFRHQLPEALCVSSIDEALAAFSQKEDHN